MARSDEILAEMLDVLVKHDNGEIPTEVGELLNIGLRLYNECPNIDPVFMDGLGQRLEQERQAVVAQRAAEARRAAPQERVPWLPRTLRVATAVATACAVLVLLAFAPPWRNEVQASLSQVITLFQGVQVEQQPRLVTPYTAASRTTTMEDVSPISSTLIERFDSLAAAQEAVAFALRDPGYLPANVTFRGVNMWEIQGQQVMELFYLAGSSELLDAAPVFAGPGDAGVLRIYEMDSEQTPEEVAFSLRVGLDVSQAVEVGGRPALWVNGRWNLLGRWQRGGKQGMVLVEDGDLFLAVWSNLGRAETLRIAASLLR